MVAFEGGVQAAARRPRRRLRAATPERGGLSPHETALLSTVAVLLIPTDELGPGAAEAGVPDALERRLRQSSAASTVYRSGLANLDSMAWRRYRQSFTALPAGAQIELLTMVEQLASPVTTRGGKIVDRLLRLYRFVRYPAVQFFPVLWDDVMEAFYTSPVAWRWLTYDGPPMPLGYLDVLAPRE